MLAVPLDPLQEVAALTELHDDEQLATDRCRNGVEHFDHMSVINLCLKLNLTGK